MALELENLPTEIKILLLSKIGEVDTLFTLLKASPKFLQVYRDNREKIYTDVIFNHITPTLLPIALLVLVLRDAKQPADISLLNHYISQTTNGYSSLSNFSIQALRRLLRFHRLVEIMAGDAMNESLLYIKPYLQAHSSDVSWNKPSMRERCRAFRGFYNWEVFTLLGEQYFEVRWMDRSIANPQLGQYFLHSSTLVFHELEEIFFVIYYLRERLSQLLDRVEDDRYNQFLTLGPREEPYKFVMDGDDIFASFVFRSLQNDWLGTHLYGRQLETQRAVFTTSTPEARLKLFQNLPLQARVDYWVALEYTLLSYRTRSLPTLTSSLPPENRSIISDPAFDFGTSQFTDSVDSATLGLLFACRHYPWPSPVTTERDAKALDTFVPIGLAIWDVKRLRSMRFFQQDLHLIGSQVSLFTERQHKPSVSTRVQRQESQWRVENRLR